VVSCRSWLNLSVYSPLLSLLQNLDQNSVGVDSCNQWVRAASASPLRRCFNARTSMEHTTTIHFRSRCLKLKVSPHHKRRLHGSFGVQAPMAKIKWLLSTCGNLHCFAIFFVETLAKIFLIRSIFLGKINKIVVWWPGSIHTCLLK